MKHRAWLTLGSRSGDHGRCDCGRLIFLAAESRSQHDGRVVARGGWRHVSNPTATMIPAVLRFPVSAPIPSKAAERG